MGLIMRKGVPYASGSEIPEGGTKGQVLAKASNISGDFEWVNGGGGGGGTGEVPTIDQVIAKGYTTTRSIEFSEENGNDRNSINYRGLSLSGASTEGLRQVQYSQHGIKAIDNLVGTMTDIFSVDFDNKEVAMSDEVKEAFLTALGLTKMNITMVDGNDVSHTYEVFGREVTTP